MSELKLDFPKAGSIVTLTGFGKERKFLIQSSESMPNPESITGSPRRVKLELVGLPTAQPKATQ